MAFPGRFPTTRLRRNRSNPNIRALVAEHVLLPSDLIWPIFVVEGNDIEVPIASMPGVSRLSVDRIVAAAKRAKSLEIPALAIFPYTDPSLRDPTGAEAFNPDNLVCRAIRAIRDVDPDMILMCDVALDPYTDHGHDGLMEHGRILNDATNEALCKQALNQAAAGCDTLAPSDMMDGRIGAIRSTLDTSGFQDCRIMSYAAKYASAYYGPFRDAVGSSSALVGDKRSYQMDPANTDESLREVALDLAEGADMVMVKPGLPYLDILRRVKETFRTPTLVYQVSGEYAQIRFGAQAGIFDEERIVFESLIAFKRAGADGIMSYFAPMVAEQLN